MPAVSPWDKLRPTSQRENELRKIKDDRPASASSPADDSTRPVSIHAHHYWSGGKGNSIVRTKVYEPVSSTFWSITGRSVGPPRNPHQNLSPKNCYVDAMEFARNNSSAMSVCGLQSDMLLGAPEKMANLLKKPDNKLYAQQWENRKVENAESRKVENARYTPVVEMPQEKFRHFLAPPPRTALATAKRKEVENFQNPDIPFKLSHLGNTLYTPAMIEVTPPPASQIVRMVPVQQNEGKVKNGINKPSSASHGNKESQAFATNGGNVVDGRKEKGMKPFEKMLGFEHAFLAHMRSREGRSEVRPYSSKGSNVHALAADCGSSRPATVPSGSSRVRGQDLPKHIACASEPRRESLMMLQRTLKSKDATSLLETKPIPDILPRAHSFHWAPQAEMNFRKAQAHEAMDHMVTENHMNESAARSSLVRTRLLKKGDVHLLHEKFKQLDRNNDEKISWQEFEWGRQSLPSSVQRPLNELFLAEKKMDINFSQFINVVGPVYLEFAKLEKQGVRFNQLSMHWC